MSSHRLRNRPPRRKNPRATSGGRPTTTERGLSGGEGITIPREPGAQFAPPERSGESSRMQMPNRILPPPFSEGFGSSSSDTPPPRPQRSRSGSPAPRRGSSSHSTPEERGTAPERESPPVIEGPPIYIYGRVPETPEEHVSPSEAETRDFQHVIRESYILEQLREQEVALEALRLQARIERERSTEGRLGTSHTTRSGLSGDDERYMTRFGRLPRYLRPPQTSRERMSSEERQVIEEFWRQYNYDFDTQDLNTQIREYLELQDQLVLSEYGTHTRETYERIRFRDQMERLRSVSESIPAMIVYLNRRSRGESVDEAIAAAEPVATAASLLDFAPYSPEVVTTPRGSRRSAARLSQEEHGRSRSRTRRRRRERERRRRRFEEDVDRAFSEDAPFLRGRRTTESDLSHRVIQELRRLRFLQTEVLIPEEIRAASRFIGRRFSSRMRRLWESILTPQDREEVQQLRRMQRRALSTSDPMERRTLEENMYDLARGRLYPRVSRRFWNAVMDDTDLRTLLEGNLRNGGQDRGAGLRLRRDHVPAWELPDGTLVRLSLEHDTRVSDDPTRAIDPTNLIIAPLAENTDLLEYIRALDRGAFQ